MEADPLQQLRDVHLPPDPSWWPPAIGWWVAAAVAVLLVIWCATSLLRAYQRRAPIRYTRQHLTQLFEAYQSGSLDAETYLHRSNELIKRLLVRALGKAELGPLAGQPWLEALDAISGSQQFTDGAGRVLGNARFSTHPQVDVEALNQAYQRLLKGVRP